MMRDAEKTIGNLIDKQGVSYIASISEDGFPNIKAMLPPRKRIGIKEFYFTTNTSSMRAAQYRKNPNASIYFCDKRFFRGVMLVGSIDAYVNKDLDRAQEVLEHDDIVDSLFLEAKKEVIQLIRKEEDHGEEAADLLMIAKYFERIGDHAVNISEWVVFSITGKHDKNY